MRVYDGGRKKIPLGDKLGEIHTRLLGTLRGFNVWSVDGEGIRADVDIDFVAGGNPGVYQYVPDGELWVENVYGSVDVIATAFHECLECTLMIRDGLSYSHAHDVAAGFEVKLRQVLVGGTMSFSELEAELSSILDADDDE
jgi:hypothetical protein